MTLIIHYPSSCFTNKLLHHTTPKSIKFTIISQNSPQSQEPTTTNDPITKPTPQSGLGFGSAQQPKPNSTPPSSSSSSSSSSGKMKKGRRDIIRRNPVEKPAFLEKKNGVEEIKETSLNESAFLLTWLVLGGLIFVEGIALSASGFLPEKWDKLFVKYVYPSFTPTVFLFVAASVVYGVIKYFENENARSPK